MNKPAKITLGVLSVIPLVWFLLFFLVFFGLFFWLLDQEAKPGATPGNRPPAPVIFLFVGHAATILFMFALTAFYIVYLFRTPRVAQDKKALWAVVLFLGNAFAFPVFWYLYIWREPSPAAPA